MENAKTSHIPETINEKAQGGDEESLTPSEARNFRTCVGKAMYLSHHRPDIQHSVNTLSRSMRNPTVIAMRRLKKLARYLAWRRVKCIRNSVLIHMQKRCKCQSTAIGLTTEKLVKAAVEEQFSFTDVQCSRGHARKRQELFRAQKPSCYGIGSGAIEGLGAAQLLREWQYKTVPLLQTDSQSALAVCKRRGPGRMKHIELKMLAVQEWLKTGRLRIRKVSTHDNPADLMTKAMNREKLIKFGRALNLRGAFFTDLSQLCTVTSD